jgi:hypothetical protein
MANIHRKEKVMAKKERFRFLAEIDSLTDEQLEGHGYYRGFPCAHNHTIRDSEKKWCYHCVHKILSNRCGFDINYVHTDYKFKYYRAWNKVDIRGPEDCWPIATSDPYYPKRICMPSYRSNYSHQKAENVSFHKALYQCAWGDVGSMVVTRTCENPRCSNPLHMVSSWNQVLPPSQVHPFVLEFQAPKLMVYINNKDNAEVFQQNFRMVIKNPLEQQEITE